jgi:hypothetical protein
MVRGQKEIVWTCSDGRKFFDKAEADRYEITLQVRELIKDNTYECECSVDRIIDVVIDRFDDIYRIVKDDVDENEGIR